MSRKKHTHQTKSEAHAEEAVLNADSVETSNGETKADGDAFKRATAEANGRLRRIVHGAEEVAKKRLHGTRAELMLDAIPARLEKALDALLDRVGLVRKSKLEGARAERNAPTVAEAQPA